MSVKGLNDVIINPIVGRITSSNGRISIFPNHSWDIKIDTQILANEDKIKEYVTEITKLVHWSFGYKDFQNQLSKDYLSEKGYL